VSLSLSVFSSGFFLTDVLVSQPVRHESSLPHLPVPTLKETAQRYLTSIRPYHTPQEPTSSNTSPLPSWSASENAVKEFVESPLVKELQDRLLKRAEGRDSWLSEWWNETAYFGWRGPIVPGERTTLPNTRLQCTNELENVRCQLFLQSQGR